VDSEELRLLVDVAMPSPAMLSDMERQTETMRRARLALAEIPGLLDRVEALEAENARLRKEHASAERAAREAAEAERVAADQALQVALESAGHWKAEAEFRLLAIRANGEEIGALRSALAFLNATIDRCPYCDTDRDEDGALVHDAECVVGDALADNSPERGEEPDNP